MTNTEAIEKLERQKIMVCHGCVHPSMVGWCEDHCRLPEAFDMAIKALKAQEQLGNHSPKLDSEFGESSHSLIFGYPLEYLVAFAEACRRANVDESDLKTFANNCTFAYATMAEEYRQQINRAIDAFMGNAGGTNESD